MSNMIEKTIYARIDGVNVSDGMINLLCSMDNSDKINLKGSLADKEKYTVNCVYKFNVVQNADSERNTAFIEDAISVSNLDNIEEANDVLRKFYPCAELDYIDLKNKIYETIDKIECQSIHDVTKSIVDKYSNDFFVYPAATKLHHAYIGGLAFHTIGMIEIAEGFFHIYPCLNRDYLYAGILLHDIGKTIEFTGVQNTEYGLEGQLLGHLVIGSQNIMQAALELGYASNEEILVLQHLIISHHGQPSFGSAKRPMTAEALLLWYIDTLDSKFRVLQEELDKIEGGQFTETIGVLDRMKFYKPKKLK